jgi:hypothetical protein
VFHASGIRSVAMAEGVTAEGVTVEVDKVVTGAGDIGDTSPTLSPVILVIVGEPVNDQYVQLLLDRVVTGKTHLCIEVEMKLEARLLCSLFTILASCLASCVMCYKIC